ncbi:MAG: cytochrome P450, partial [Mycobacterium sp.]|uniref:cytochrome P450 n=1 Tax=Mycobacterium sp. TaxID=1785 RepID=UPI003BAFCB1B
YDDVAAAFKDYRTYSSTSGLDLAMVRSDSPPPKIILFMDPPEHRRMRSLVSKAFTPRAIRSLRDTVIDLVRRYLKNADPRRFDVMQEFSGPFPVDVITRMLGVPEELSQQVRTWFDDGMGQEPGRMEKSETAVQALAEAAAYFLGLVQERRAQPRNDMISTLIAAEVERADDEATRLEDHEIVLFAMMLAAAGTETVAKLIGSAVAVSAQNPKQWQKLLDDRSKIPAAVDEVLRYDGPVLYNVRCTTKEVAVGGVTIPADKPVLLCLASANRDSAAFTEADTFDVERDRGQPQHLGFGGGIHSCLGAALARMETAIALEHLLDFMPRYEVIWQDCKRVTPTSVAGWQHLPVRVLQ